VPAICGQLGKIGAELPGGGGLPDDSVEIRTAEGEARVGDGGDPTVERARPGVCDEDGDILYIEDVSGADEAVGGDLSVVPHGASANVEDAYGARLLRQELEMVPRERRRARPRRRRTGTGRSALLQDR
jgi:hypothetical protein